MASASPAALAQDAYPTMPDEPDAAPISAAPAGLTTIASDAPVDESAIAASLDQPNAGFTINVNTLVDEWSTEPDLQQRAKAKCSLREALQATVTSNPEGNQGCGAPSIANFSEYTFDMLPGTYLLTLGKAVNDPVDQLPAVMKKIFIDGKKSITINGGGQQGRRYGIFYVGSGGELSLKDINLQYGLRPFGGAIILLGGSSGVVKGTNVDFYKNLADNGPTTGDGGAVAVDSGTFICIECKFRENVAHDDGGAISAGNASVLLDRVDFFRNQAQFKGGAAAFTGGSEVTHPIIRNSKFRVNFIMPANVPANWPGSYSFFDDDSGGGALYVGGYTELETTQLFKNYSMRSKGGGAIYNQGFILMVDSAVADNKARSDPKVPNTLGGGILNDGDLFALRVSIHGNEANFGGGVMNRTAGSLYLANTTVADNQANSGGGVENGFNFKGQNNVQYAQDGGEIRLYHSTIARAVDNLPESIAVSNYGTGEVFMANSILDTPCVGTFRTHGGNVFKKFCQRIDVENNAGNFDHVAQEASEIKLGGLTNNGGANLPEAQFLSIKPEGQSPAIDLGQDGYCTDPDINFFIRGKDQIGATRPNGPACDSGSIETGTFPPKWESEPYAVGAGFHFPITVPNNPTTNQTLIIKNTGGGFIQWDASIENGGSVFTFESGQATSGVLTSNQSTPVVLRCTPLEAQGWYYATLIFKTNTKEMPEARYPIDCKKAGNPEDPASWGNPRPGPVSGGPAPVSGTAKTQLSISNLGSADTMQLGYNMQDALANTMQIAAIPGAAGASVSPASATSGNAAIPPGGKLTLEISCTPPALGLFTGRLVITTNDPVDPEFEYGVSCQGVVPPTAEKLALTQLFEDGAPPARGFGLAISPSGDELMVGHWDDNIVRVYALDPNTGEIGAIKQTLAPAGMDTIDTIRYSPDGNSAYWTTMVGDGVVVAQRQPNGLFNVLYTRTKNSVYLCGVIQFCAIDAMDGARSLDISPDGTNVYVAGGVDDSLAVFSRDQATGDLFFTQKFTQTVEGQNVLDGAINVLASADGQNVYVQGRGDVVAAFTRKADGRLSFLQVLRNGVNGVSGIAGAQDMALSPDGRFAYVLGYSSNALAIFERSLADGFLTFVQALPVQAGPYAVNVSHDPEGDRLLVSHWNGDSVQVFRREISGTVELIQTVSEGIDSPTFNGAVNMVSSRDDDHVYVSLWGNNGQADGTVRLLKSIRQAPLPSSMSPSSALAGSADLALTVLGSRFYPESIVLWNGQQLATTYVSQGQLDAVVPAGLLTAAGTGSVRVRTFHVSGAHTSDPALPFAIVAVNQQPGPSIESLNPPSAEFGGSPLTVVVNGANFTPETQALLNGVPVSTSFLSATALLVQLSAADLTSSGPLAITVVNGLPPAGMAAAEVDAIKKSSPVLFTAAPPNTAQPPSISGFQPGSAGAGSGEQWITVKGAGFSSLDGQISAARWNGGARNTVVLDGETIQMRLTAVDVSAATTAQVTIYTPGETESPPVPFRVLAPGVPPVPSVESAYIEVIGNALWLTVSGADFQNGANGSVVRLNGSPRETVWINPYQLEARISQRDIAVSNSLRVTTPGSGTSNGLAFPAQFPNSVLTPVVRKTAK